MRRKQPAGRSRPHERSLMRLIFIRHAEPDYKNNTLTAKGFREAAILAKRTAAWSNVRGIFVSPLARAQPCSVCAALRRLRA